LKLYLSKNNFNTFFKLIKCILYNKLNKLNKHKKHNKIKLISKENNYIIEDTKRCLQ